MIAPPTYQPELILAHAKPAGIALLLPAGNLKIMQKFYPRNVELRSINYQIGDCRDHQISLCDRNIPLATSLGSVFTLQLTRHRDRRNHGFACFDRCIQNAAAGYFLKIDGIKCRWNLPFLV